MMFTRRDLFGFLPVALGIAAFERIFGGHGAAQAAADGGVGAFPIQYSDEEWRRRLSPTQYKILRGHGTEPPGSSSLDKQDGAGTYRCAGCDTPMFSSKTKYDSGTGWPSFWAPLEGAVGTSVDRTLLWMTRTEVHCSRCGGHLGHVFDDGPPPTGLRYCINGAALKFVAT
jgi:peptide-methionine (R)-S-oxide reductase